MRPRAWLLASVAAWLVAACSTSSAEDDGGTAAALARVAAFECAPTDGPRAAQPIAPGERLQVATTVAPITSIVATIAGDRADVRGVIPEGQDSHTYEPKPGVAKVLAASDVVFLNGLSLELPARELARRNAPAQARIVELGNETIDETQYLYDFSFPRDGGRPNPHLWTNPPMAACYANVVAAELASADPNNAEYYAANLTAFTAQVDELDRLMHLATDSLPIERRALLTYHDAYAYFAAHYGWRVIGAIQVSSFEDPTPKEVAALVRQVKGTGVPAIFGSEVFPSPVLAQIGEEAGVRYVDTLRDDDLPGDPGDADHSYLGLMKHDFVTMIASLGGDESGLATFDTRGGAPDRAEYPR